MGKVLLREIGLLADVRHRRRLGLHFRGSRSASCAADVFLGLGGVVAGVLLHGRGGGVGVVAGEVLDLSGLRVHHVLCVGDVGVDEFFVVHVDQRSEVDAGDAD